METTSRELLEKGIAALHASQHAQSETYLREALSLGTHRAEGLFYLGLALSGRGDPAAGLAALEESFSLTPSLETALIGGEIALRLNERESALSWSTRITGAGPSHLTKLQSLASRHGSAGMTRAAANYFAAAFQVTPNDPELLRQLCYFVAMDDRKEAIALIESFIARNTHEPRLVSLALWLLLPQKEGELRAEQGLGPYSPYLDLHFRFATAELAKWHENVAAWLAAEPDAPNALALMGLVQVSRGDPMSAEPHLARLRKQIKTGPMAVAHFGREFFQAVDKAEHSLGEGLPGVESLAGGLPAGPYVYVGCDALYFEKFGWTLAKSFASNVQSVFLQLHIFDLKPEERAPFLDRLATVLGDARYGVTTEWTGLRGRGREAANYYHAIRYIRASQFADSVRQPLSMIDVDSFFMRSADHIFSHLGGFDTQLLFTPGRVEINNQITACYAVVNNTPAGLDYLRRVAAYIAVCREQGEMVWGIDQVALYAVYSEMKAGGRAPHAGSLPLHVFDGMYSANTIFWMAKCSEDDPAYPEFQAARARFS